jgi:hypothetical protein
MGMYCHETRRINRIQLNDLERLLAAQGIQTELKIKKESIDLIRDQKTLIELHGDLIFEGEHISFYCYAPAGLDEPGRDNAQSLTAANTVSFTPNSQVLMERGKIEVFERFQDALDATFGIERAESAIESIEKRSNTRITLASTLKLAWLAFIIAFIYFSIRGALHYFNWV